MYDSCRLLNCLVAGIMSRFNCRLLIVDSSSDHASLLIGFVQQNVMEQKMCKIMLQNCSSCNNKMMFLIYS